MNEENSDDDAFESADEDDLVPGQDESDKGRDENDISLDVNEKNQKVKVRGQEVKRIINVKKVSDASNMAPISGGATAAISSDSHSCSSETPAIPDDSSSLSGALASTISNASEAAVAATVAAPAAGDSWSAWGDWGGSEAAASPILPASAAAAEEDSWSSWGNWGASLLSTASKSVSQFSTDVTEGLNVLVDVSTSDNEDQEQDEAAKKAAQQVKEDVIESQPAVDIPALSTGLLPSDDPGCPLSDPPTSTSSSSTAPSSTLSSFTSGFFSSATSFDAASAAAGFSSAFGSLPTLSSFSSALSSSSSAAEGSSSSALTTPSVAGETLAGLMEGGLGVLEMVGRKTMDILKESDGGLEVTRAIFHDRRGKPTLSDLLREGKTKSEVEDGQKEEVLQERKKSFQFWFDEYKGMAHLEALELLNNCCETDIKELLKENHDDSLNPALITIKNIFVKDEDDDENDDNDEAVSFTEDEEEVLRQMMRKHAEQFGPESATKAPVDVFVNAVKEAWGRVGEMEKMIEADEGGADAGKESRDRRDVSADEVPNEVPTTTASTTTTTTTAINADPSSVHRACIENLANMVAKSVGLFHKIGQMTLVPITGETSSSSSSCTVDGFVERLSHLIFLSKLLTANIDGAATAFGQLLPKFEGRRSEIEINQVMTDIFLEASQGTSHVRSAFKLLLPVMQVRFLKESEQNRD